MRGVFVSGDGRNIEGLVLVLWAQSLFRAVNACLGGCLDQVLEGNLVGSHHRFLLVGVVRIKRSCIIVAADFAPLEHLLVTLQVHEINFSLALAAS